MVSPLFRRPLATLVALLCLNATQAAPAAVPPALVPWQGWVLRDQPEYHCPRIAVAPVAAPHIEQLKRRCRWPGPLQLDVGSSGAEFAQPWQLFAENWVTLPGDAGQWPVQVAVDGRPAAVLERDGRPAVQLGPGQHRISGRLRWPAPPQSLAIAPDSALVALRVDGAAAPAVVDADGRLWLQREDGARAADGNQVQVEVFRRLDDGVPLGLVTELRLAVAGQPREVLLGQLLPAGAEPVQFESPLPARIEPDGRLRLQVRAGEWRIALTARFTAAVGEFGFHRTDDQWPAQEIWSFRAAPALRMVKVEGATAVDPSQLDLPADFAGLPTFLLTPERRLRLTELQRGDAVPAPHQLRLQRTLWLDFDGRGATARDQISGRFGGDWRLRAHAGLGLGRVAVNGEPQLVTTLPDTPGAGIEVRAADAMVEAVSRIEPRQALTAAGWDTAFDAIEVALQLPPGWQLWHASGPDRVLWSWLSRWDLWDLFVCLLTTAILGRVLGARWAPVTAATLALSYQGGAPAWGWALLAGLAALLRALPPGHLRRVARGVAAVGLLAMGQVLLQFVVDQARSGLYPQLETRPGIDPTPAQAKIAGGIAAPAQRAFESADLASANTAPAPTREPGPRYRATDNVQTGPGEPAWHWRAAQLSWTGPVAADAGLSLYLSPPWLTRSLNGVQILLATGLFFALARALWPQLANPELHRLGSGTTRAALWPGGIALVAATALWSPPGSASTFPPPALLDELRAQLLQAPDCAPACAAVSQARVELAGTELRLYLSASAGAAVAFPLPFDASWRALEVFDQGAPVAVAREADRLWVALTPGSHELLMTGLATASALSLPFPLPPRNLTVSAPDWEIEGLAEGRMVGDSLLLQRRARGSGQDPLPAPPIAPFVQVARALDLDLDGKLTTTVTRVAPATGPINLRIPLLPGEVAVDKDLTLADRDVVVALDAQQTQYQWRSVLTPTDSLALTAPVTSHWSEEWRLNPSPRWHQGTPSLAPVKADPGNGQLSPRVWRPWPGERLALSLTRPVAVVGPTTTVEQVALDYRPAARGAALELGLGVRSSLGGDYPIRPPAGARLLRIAIDDIEQPLPAPGNGELALPLRPGLQHIDLQWELPGGIASWTRTPAIALASPANNVTLALTLPASRWPLLTRGPALGPALQYWAVLGVIIAAAAGLGIATRRGGLSIPLGWGQWLLLGIGLSTVGGVGGIAVVAWFFALEMRRRRPPTRWFNLAQVGLVALTLVAAANLLGAVPQSLLALPDMQVAGNGSSDAYYRWYQDRSGIELPQGAVFSLPLWLYRIAMLSWSLWLAVAAVGWIRWGWGCFTTGQLWAAGSGGRRSRRVPAVDGGTADPSR